MSSDPASKYSSNGADFLPSHHDTYPYIDPLKANLAGKNVLVIGASKGIGRCIALSFARAGASSIAIAARSSLDTLAKELENAASEAGRQKPKVLPLALDVSQWTDVQRAAEQVKTSFSHLDVIITNSGLLEPVVNMLESDPETWWRTWEVNVKGSYHVIRGFLPLVLASPNKDKTVVTLTSIGATLAMPGLSSYQTGKMALCRLMEFVNCEYGKQGVLAYSAHPGSVLTDMGKSLPEEWHVSLQDTPELPADTLVWLTKERREWLAGRYIACPWDMQELEKKREIIERRDLLKFRLAMGHEDSQNL